MSYNKTISFPIAPKSFKVSFYGDPPVSAQQTLSESNESLNKGKSEATAFYQQEIQKLRGEIANEQQSLLASINSKVDGNIIIKSKTDPNILGGLIVKVGSKLIDTSIRSKLAKLKNNLKEVG